MAVWHPALQEIRLIGIEDTPPIMAPVLPGGPGRHLEIPLDSATAAAHVHGDGRRAPALAVQGPHRVIARLPAGGALGRPGLLGRGRGRWGHWDGAGPIGPRHGLLVLRRVDGIERPARRREHVGEGFGEVLQYMKAVRHLRGGRCPLPRALSIRTGSIPGDPLHLWGLPQPLRHRRGGALREPGHRLTALEVDQDRAVGLALPQGEIVHPKHPGRGKRRGRLPAEQTQARVPAHPHVPRVTEAHPGFPAQRHTKGDEALGQPQGAARPGGRHRGQALGEDAARTGTIAAQPFADPQLEADLILRPGQVCQGAPIGTMEAPRWSGAERTGGAGLRRLHAQGDLRRGVVDVTRL